MKKILPLLTLPLLLATSCEQAQKAREGYNNLEKLSKAGEQMEANMEASKTRRAEREQHGDTLALSYKDLQNYLPANVSGYAAQEPSGQSMKVSGMSFSTAERKFTKDADEVEVKLVDYNGANQLFQGASMMFSLGLESEDSESRVQSVSFKQEGVKGMETLHKNSGETELVMAVGDRFIVTITGTHQKDFALVEDIAQRMDLAKLTKL